MSGWVTAVFAGLAVVVSGWTWYVQWRDHLMAQRRARVTVAFHWLPVRAKVPVKDGHTLEAGYHIVLANHGPAPARDVVLELRDSVGRDLELLDLGADEMPLAVLDIDGRYPIPWLYEPFTRHARRFTAKVSWNDAAGHHERTVPLRRGQLPISPVS